MTRYLRYSLAIAAIPLAVLLSASSCGAPATQDRTSGGGKNPDLTADTTHVTVYLNADNVPNIALFCIDPGDGHGPMAIMSTLSGTDTGGNKASAITRMPDLNSTYCGGKPR